MTTPASPDTVPFSPRFSDPTYVGVDEEVYAGEPQAWLTFPDMGVAVEFINTAGAEHYARHSGGVTVEQIKRVHEAPTGEHGQLDAFVKENPRTGEVRMMVRHYGHRYPEAHAALSDLVMRSIEEMTQNDTAEIQ